MTSVIFKCSITSNFLQIFYKLQTTNFQVDVVMLSSSTRVPGTLTEIALENNIIIFKVSMVDRCFITSLPLIPKILLSGKRKY